MQSMKKLSKRVFKSSYFRRLICWLIASYIRFVYYTNHKDIQVDEGAIPYAEGKLPAVICFWHGRLLMIPMISPKNRKASIVISSHSDGQIISGAMENFGFSTITGSTTRGGVGAVINAIKALKDGDIVCVTPDGPRGPALQLQDGILAIAEKAEMPIIPVTFSASRHRLMKSWDSFMVALPFGRLHYRISEPMFNPTKAQLEARMAEITNEVDAKANK